MTTETLTRYAELEKMIGLRTDTAAMPSSLRPLLRKWVAAKTGKAATACLDLKMSDFEMLYRDTTDAKLADWALGAKESAVYSEMPEGDKKDALKAALLDLIGNTGGKAQLDMTQVESTIDAKVKAAIDALPKPKADTIVIKDGKPVATFKGTQHPMLPLMIAALGARLPNGTRINLALVGPAGTGKTHGAEQALKAVNPGEPVEVQGAALTKTDIVGFKDANGKTQTTPMSRAFLLGRGVIMDEKDSWSPSASLAGNAALANGLWSLPDGMAVRHDNFVAIANLNTWGLGADRQYVGRAQQDAADLDRYFFIGWDLSDELEAALIGVNEAPKAFKLDKGGFMTPAEWLARVRAVRKAVEVKKLRYVISPRATLYGIALMAQGIGVHWIEEGTLFKGMTANDRMAVEACVKNGGR